MPEENLSSSHSSYYEINDLVTRYGKIKLLFCFLLTYLSIFCSVRRCSNYQNNPLRNSTSKSDIVGYFYLIISFINTKSLRLQIRQIISCLSDKLGYNLSYSG